MYRIVDLQRVHMYSDPDNFCAEVSMANLGNGELVGVFAQNRGLFHTDTGTLLLVRSRDNGQTWGHDSAVTILKEEEDAGWNIGAIVRLRDGTLLVHANRWRYLDQGRIDRRGISEIDGVWLTRSTDKGMTWSTPERVNFAPMRNARVRDAVVELPNGDLLMPLHGFRYQRTLPDISSSERERSFVLWSPNKGKSWHYYGTMAYDPAEIIHYHEPGLVRLHDGRLLGLMRTQRWPSPSDPGEQMGPPSGFIYTALSEDDGMSWGWPRTTRIWGYPVDGITLRDGSVLAAYSYRTRPMGVRIAISPDAQQWCQEDVFTLASYDPRDVTPCFPTWAGEPLDSIVQRGTLWHIGYPSSILLDDGRVFTGYHLFNEQGRQYVEGAIYAVERDR
ncbi:MAG: glycoside hydrolase [Chloroflexota bacterium]|nr:glycoside hydrolase [Chloroflexota bacterium]